MEELIMSQDSLDNFILNNYSNRTVASLAQERGCIRGTITRRAKKLGLEKEKTFILLEGDISHSLDDSRLSRYRITNLGRVYNIETNKLLTPN